MAVERRRETTALETVRVKNQRLGAGIAVYALMLVRVWRWWLACAGEHACGDELGTGQARRTSCRKEVRGTGDTSLL